MYIDTLYLPNGCAFPLLCSCVNVLYTDPRYSASESEEMKKHQRNGVVWEVCVTKLQKIDFPLCSDEHSRLPYRTDESFVARVVSSSRVIWRRRYMTVLANWKKKEKTIYAEELA